MNKVNYDPDATVVTVGASLSWGLIKNQAFIDGNKRIGLGALAVFPKAHGYVLTCSAEEETAMVLRAAASEIIEEEWTVWVVGNVGSLRWIGPELSIHIGKLAK
jgi:death-on-curing protein